MEIVIIVAVGMVLGILISRKFRNSASVVVTGPGVLKTHDVEAKFRLNGKYHGKLAQSRWSDGQERFILRLRGLMADHDGQVRLFRNVDQVSEFEITGSALSFEWKGMSSDDIPKFEIGDQVRVDIGSMSLLATVEAD